ncbi:MAG: Rid family detoxifying hydrolase [Myxococcales bacterium]|nr:Rid family detoxifying hydrolase [Myxococcales bacterium]
MERKVVQTSKAPAAVGAYSQAVHIRGAEELLFVSGQIGLDPTSGEMVSGGVEAEAKQAMLNLQAILTEQNFRMGDVVRATLYLTHMEDFAKVNAIYADFFSGEPPSRAAIGVKALPKGALFEIDAIVAR